MSERLSIGVVGAGVVGLSTALSLQRRGHDVTLIDRSAPGEGTSSGNAGVFADYARLPFATRANLRAIPGLLMDPEGPLSIQPRYLPHLAGYGWRFVLACREDAYLHGRAALTALQVAAPQADFELLEACGAKDLVRHAGCLALVGTAAGLEAALAGHFRERREQGVNLRMVGPDEVAELEPGLARFHAGGVFYPDTRHTVDPLALSRRYAEGFVRDGGHLVLGQVDALAQDGASATVRMGDGTRRFDRVVVCAGYAAAQLLVPLGLKVPLASERGYHLMLDGRGHGLGRPVVWLDRATFLTPMAEGIRVAGTAEFAHPDAPPSEKLTRAMLACARRMLGGDAPVLSTWVGSRPSTPDSLPVIGPVPGAPSVSVAFGHGHLGLTLAAITGKLVAESLAHGTTSVDLAPFRPGRFH